MHTNTFLIEPPHQPCVFHLSVKDGAVNGSWLSQESRVSRAVEVMIQHVENLKRMYAKEHAELEELKQALLQNDRSFNSLQDEGKGRRGGSDGRES